MPSPATWDHFAPLYQHLQAEPLTSAMLPAWLNAWSDAEKAVWEARAWLKRAKLIDMLDSVARDAYQQFMQEIFPPFRQATQALIAKLLAMQDYEPLPEHARFVHAWRMDNALYQEANVGILQTITQLQQTYEELIWSTQVHFRGTSLTPPAVRVLDGARDQHQRAAIWQAKYTAWQAQSSRISELFLELVRQRHHLARNAGCSDYRTYRWQELHRFDFTPEDCLVFEDAVTREFSDLTAQMVARRTQRWGVTALQPWDWQLDTDPVASEQVFATDESLLDAVGQVCQRLDVDLGALLGRMRQQHFIDAGARPGKPAGGEEWFFPLIGLPCIRVETTGTFNDVLLLLHECGHAWHEALSLTHNGLVWNMGGPGGFDEFPSVSLPFLGLHLCAEDLGGFARPEQIDAMLVRECERIVLCWLPEIIRMELFQHWVYTQPPENLQPADLDAQWLALTRRCLPWMDWSQQSKDVAISWQRSTLLFDSPFYHTEYALAQIGAMQLLQRMRHDQSGTLSAFKSALMAGGTRSLGELYRMMGIASPFSSTTIRDMATFMTQLYQGLLT